MNKEEIKKLFNSYLENYDKYNIYFDIMPDETEMINCDGSGKRFIKYVRTITIIDKEHQIEEIKKERW